jgi:hypothetical protein
MTVHGTHTHTHPTVIYTHPAVINILTHRERDNIHTSCSNKHTYTQTIWPSVRLPVCLHICIYHVELCLAEYMHIITPGCGCICTYLWISYVHGYAHILGLHMYISLYICKYHVAQCICTYPCTYANTYVHFPGLHMYISLYICKYICTFPWIAYVHIPVHMQIPCSSVYMYISLYICKYTCTYPMHIYISLDCICTYPCTYANSYVHIPVHMQIHMYISYAYVHIPGLHMYISLYICKYHVAQCVSMFITAGCVTVVKTVVKICK